MDAFEAQEMDAELAADRRADLLEDNLSAEEDAGDAPPPRPNPRLIGSTDAAAILGLSRWAGPRDVYNRIVEGYERPRTFKMQRGLDLEDDVALAWSALNHRQIEKLASIDRVNGREWQRCSFDYVTVNFPKDLVEIKTTEHADGWGEEEDDVPTEYLIQCQVQLEAAGLRIAHVPVLVVGRGLDLRHKVTADPEMQSNILEALARFWTDHIVPKKPPEWTASEDAYEYLRSRWPRDVSSLRIASAEERRIIESLAARKAELSKLETETATLEIALKEQIRDAEGLALQVENKLVPLVTYRKAKDSDVTDYEAVAKTLASMLEIRGERVDSVFKQHTSARTGSRRLLLKVKG